MGPMRLLFILALVLLEVAVGTEDGGCDRSSCEVTGVQGALAKVECSAAIYQTTEGTITSPVTSVNTLTSHHSTVKASQDLNLTNISNQGTFNFSSGEQNDTSDFDLEEFESNETSTRSFEILKEVSEEVSSTVSDYQTFKMSATKVSIKENTSRESSNTLKNMKHNLIPNIFRSNWEYIKTVEVSLSKNCLVFDLSPFYNTTTVILQTFGHSSFETCGVSNILCLSCVSSSLNEIRFVRSFVNLESLNLTDNKISRFPLLELPLSIKSLDLSYNNVIFDTNTTLPDNLQTLNVSHNSLQSFNNTVIKGNLLILDIRGNRLNEIPFLDMENLEELHVSDNHILSLKEGEFKHLTSLTLLDLRKNHLTSLDERVFLGLNKLQWLDMSENKVTSLAPSTFQYINNLVTLSLSGNTNLGNLQDIEDASFLFGTGQRLQIIEASRTNLTRIPSTLTRSVRKMLLADNAIGSIQCGDLDSFPLLQTMDLSRNLIVDIEEDAFGRLEFLSNLLLSGNKLTTIPKSLPNQLQVFDLRCNLIEKLNENDFIGLQRLKVLLLSRNKITILEDGAFGQLSSLEVLDLSHNPIKSLSRTSFIGPRKLKEIYLISLKDLIPLEESLSFPAPESAHLEVLNMESSPVLATQLMDDVAALTMFHELYELNLNHCRMSTLRSDLPKYLPRLHKLQLTGNSLNCTNIIWLVKWLQALNISMQDKGRFRREIYNLKDICCEEARDSYDEAGVICASPEYLSGKEIISLKEEDFPDLKLTSSTLPPPKQVLITEHYPPTLADSASNISQSVSAVIDSTSKTTLSMLSSAQSSSTEMPRYFSSTEGNHESQVTKPVPIEAFSERSINLTTISNNPHSNEFEWTYLKSKTNHELSPDEPVVVVVLNDTRHVQKDIDNHLNDSISSGAYLSHEQLPASHPGMVVFLLVVGSILIATAATVYSQCSRGRRGTEYHQQQDIEVSSFGVNELW